MIVAIDLGLWGYTYVWASPPRTIAQVAAMAEIPPNGGGTTSVLSTTNERTINLMLLRDLRVLTPYVGLVPLHRLPWSGAEKLRLSGAEWVRRPEGWTRLDHPMPRVRIVSDARVSTDPARDVVGLDIDRTGLVDRELPRLSPAEDGRVEVVRDQPGRIELHVALAQRALLGTTETYDAGVEGRR